MTGAKYLTGDSVAINEFIDRFDVSRIPEIGIGIGWSANSPRHSCLTAMVRHNECSIWLY